MSTVEPVRAALVALWQATPDLDGVQVRRGRRTTNTLGERISVGRATGARRPVTFGPKRVMEETYSVECWVSVTTNGPAADQPKIDARADVIYDAAEYAVRSAAGQNLGIASTPTRSVRLVEVAGDFATDEAAPSETKGPINASIRFAVRVEARYRLP